MSDWNTPLTLTAVTAGSTVQLTKTGSPTVSGLQYRTDSSAAWSSYTIDDVITLANVGDYVQFQNTESALSSGASNYAQFVMTGSIACSGNIQSMLNYAEACASYCYLSLFYHCTALTSTPDIPATTLATGCYQNMFEGCSGITSTCATLPATTLAVQCYLGMYRGCSALTTAPSLPATTLTASCYYAMFYNCSALTAAPTLAATTLADSCYYYMFSGCRALTTTPQLPATALVNNCYRGMFNNCSGLTSAADLPATTLAVNCYYQMFDSCTNLTAAPVIGATALASNSCTNMFKSCSKLGKVYVSFTDWTNGATTDWLSGVASSGNFYKPASLPETRGVSNIPTNWTLKSEYKPLTLTAVTAGSTVQLTKTGLPTVSGLQYRTSIEAAWSAYTIDTVITLSSVGDYVQFQNTESTLSIANNKYVNFVMTGSIAAAGNIQAMLNYSEGCAQNCFRSLFQGCSSLTTPPELPSLTLANYCYYALFNDCASLQSAPALPALTAPYVCYGDMFKGCTSLVTAPELPATTLNGSVYLSMFMNCTALVNPPTTLPATSVNSDSYRGMFIGCTTLKRTPEILATEISGSGRGFERMFDGCTSLSEVHISFKAWDDVSFIDWLKNVASSGVFYKPLALPEEYGASRIPSGWQVINTDEIECSPGLPTDIDPVGVTVEEQLPLTLTAVEDSTVTLNAVGSPTTSGLKFRTQSNASWSTYTPGTTIQLPAGKSVQFWNSAETLSLSTSSYAQFIGTGGFSCRGNLQSMLNYISSVPNYAFSYLFRAFPMVNTPEMPADTVGGYGYSSLYRDIPNLTRSEALPALTAQNYAYGNMYAGSGIEHPPVIAATTYLVGSLAGMFADCGALLSAPRLLATSVSNSCLFLAFRNCTHMTSIEVDFTSWGSGDPTSNWVSGVAASGTFIKPSALPEEYGTSRIPIGWTVINKD